MTRLLLFDIDGTLVSTGGAGGRAMARAFEEVFGFSNGLRSISMAGRTDAWIVSQMAAEHGLRYDEQRFRDFHHSYVKHLAVEVLQPGPQKGVLPGVRPLLDTLASRDRPFLALLTGNFRRGAEIKLEHFELWHYFRGGAFGDDSHDRNGLLWKALADVEAAGGPAVRPSEVVIIGDTPLDVAVAVAGGARSLGVATGSYDVETLLESGADVALPDLDDLDSVLAALNL
ncbi:MAG TPA: HAD family hydrolase [Vicinamibacterales bacterium]|nr:HAD family hydrolase [Vicinamibacterales bacterium]